MKQECETRLMPFDKMGVQEIVAHFARYGFTDENGHRLELCADFLALVRLAGAKT